MKTSLFHRRHFLRAAGTIVALGRPCGFTDEELTTTIVNQARQKDFATREFIHAIVASDAFHSK